MGQAKGKEDGETRWKRGDTQWDYRRVAPPLEEFVEKAGAPAGSICVPGMGAGTDARYLAALGGQVTGIDIAPTAVKRAQAFNAHPSARYITGDILKPKKGWKASFDWVVEHTCLCALNPSDRKAYARAVRYVLKPQGYFLALFFRDPDMDDGEKGPPFGISKKEIESLFGEAFELLQAWVPSRAFESRIGREEVRWYRKR